MRRPASVFIKPDVRAAGMLKKWFTLRYCLREYEHTLRKKVQGFFGERCFGYVASFQKRIANGTFSDKKTPWCMVVDRNKAVPPERRPKNL